MAEETDTTQKPKAELIKRTPSITADETSKAAKGVSQGPEQGERRKVIVVKKKPAASSPAAAKTSTEAPTTAGTPKRIPHKVVVTKGNTAENETSPAAASEADIETSPPKTKKEGAVSFPIAQRPVAAAGKVGGKYVGPRPSHEESVRPQRGGGGRQFNRSPSDGRPGYSGRPPQGAPGRGGQGSFNRGPMSPRPGGQGGRPGGPGRGGPGNFNRGPMSPRPGGPGRPGAARPGGTRPGGFGAGSGSPPSSTDGKVQVKKTFKAKKPVYTRKDKELEMADKLLQTKKKAAQMANPVPKSIEIMEVVSVSELARKMNLKASDLIQKLITMGQMVTINQQIDADTATILAAEFGADVKIVSLYDETVIETGSDEGAEMTRRPPVVTVMGHVDHGKTKLLDAIRSADVVSGEFGGITQHIGAYTVETPNGRITFLDTPGHEAFTKMRARGAQITDIVIIVVAADDGVMPQTVEAINHAKEAGVPIIVAINKIDKPEANPDRVKTQLSDYNLIPEDWGGQTMFIEVSALKREGIDKLVEGVLLEAELLDLNVNFDRNAEGKILESRIDHGRGIVATVMIERGTLEIGDPFVAGVWPGKVRALFTDRGEKSEKATPSTPIEVLGFEGVPNAGDPFQVVDDEKTARTYSVKRQELKRFEDAKNIRKITLDNLHATITEGAIQELKVIIKSDVQGSAEALRSSLEKLSTNEIRLHVIQALPGAINEGDVDLAIASNAIIIGFNVRPKPKAKTLAESEKIDIRRYNVIYKAVEEIKLAMEGMLKPESKEEIIATVEVRDIFKTPKFGTVAGCYVQTGTVRRSGIIHVIRDDITIHTGKIGSLRRFKDDVREVAAGFECGIGLDSFDDLRAGDQFEVFEIIEVARKLSS